MFLLCIDHIGEVNHRINVSIQINGSLYPYNSTKYRNKCLAVVFYVERLHIIFK